MHNIFSVPYRLSAKRFISNLPIWIWDIYGSLFSRQYIKKNATFYLTIVFSFPTILSSSHNSDIVSSNYEIKRKAKYKLTIWREKTNKYVQYMNTEFWVFFLDFWKFWKRTQLTVRKTRPPLVTVAMTDKQSRSHIWPQFFYINMSIHPSIHLPI